MSSRTGRARRRLPPAASKTSRNNDVTAVRSATLNVLKSAPALSAKSRASTSSSTFFSSDVATNTTMAFEGDSAVARNNLLVASAKASDDARLYNTRTASATLTN